MSAGTPNAAPFHSYWGRYATHGDLPNAAGNPLPATEHAKLESGDVAFDIGSNALFFCIDPGTAAGGDAVWGGVTGAASSTFINVSGGALNTGHVVVATTGGVTTTTTQGDTRVLGVITEGGPNGDEVVIADWGARVQVLVDAAADPIAVGDRLVTSTTAGRARKSGAGPNVASTFAKALQAANTDGAMIDAIIWTA